jgi:GT2 family glycosyltransferase
MPDPALFSIVIPNWNGARHLPICLNALRGQAYKQLDVIVVDNASSDESRAIVARDYPEVKLIALSSNRGFTGACNAGIQASSGAYVALLNNDTEADPGWSAAVVDCFEHHLEAGLVASKMLLFDQRDHLHTAGDFYRVDGQPGNRGAWQRDDGQFDKETYVFSACGGSSAYRRTMLDEVGLLDDDFFFSLEDMDLAWRGQMAGWQCVYTPGALVYHHLAATGGGVTASFYDGRNAIYLLVKDYPAPLWRKYWRAILRQQARIAGDALRAWRGAAARAHLRGMLVGLLRIPWLLRKRRRVQQTRRVTIEYLESVLSSIDTR